MLQNGSIFYLEQDMTMENYRSKDFYLTAVCMAYGCKLKSLERQEGDFVEFVFEDPPEKCIEIISNHWAGNLKVNSRKLVEAINELKTRIHSNI